jgi:hypothetical protein
MNIYQAVREVFAFGSCDYERGSPEVRKFYAKIQDKFLFAVTGLTAAEIKLARANHQLPAMGLTSMKGKHPKREDVTIGKNYLILMNCMDCIFFASSFYCWWSLSVRPRSMRVIRVG